MGRVIKYRVWDKKRLLFDDELMVTQDGEICCAPIGESLFFVIKDNYVVQQFSGLSDSKGRDIYEGDIIKQYDERMQVKWSTTDALWWAADIPENGLGLELFMYPKAVIVGNIYETPDLLK